MESKQKDQVCILEDNVKESKVDLESFKDLSAELENKIQEYQSQTLFREKYGGSLLKGLIIKTQEPKYEF